MVLTIVDVAGQAVGGFWLNPKSTSFAIPKSWFPTPPTGGGNGCRACPTIIALKWSRTGSVKFCRRHRP